jgi:tRNA splicing ligase
VNSFRIYVKESTTDAIDCTPVPLLTLADAELAYGDLPLLDRAFLDNIVTQTLAAEGNGTWKEYVGGYSDWLRQRPSAAESQDARVKATATREKNRSKLSYRETREIAALPGEIAALEARAKAAAS